MNNLPIRKSNRLKNYDYTRNGAYFVTICVYKHQNFLGRVIVNNNDNIVCGRSFDGARLIDGEYSAAIKLTPLGECVDETIKNISVKYPYVSVDKYVIMPNHIHAILIVVGADIIRPQTTTQTNGSYGDDFVGTSERINDNVNNNVDNDVEQSERINNDVETSGRIISAPTGNKSINTIIGQLKRAVSKFAGFPVWQKSFHDHIIRDENDYKRIAEYIETNPQKWFNDCFYNTDDV